MLTKLREKAQVIALHENSNKSMRQIIQSLNISRSTVGPRVKRQALLGHNNVLRKRRCGRKKRKRNRIDKAMLFRTSIKISGKGKNDRAADIVESGVSVSESAMSRRLLEMERPDRKPHKK